MLNRILPALLLVVFAAGAPGVRAASLKGEPSAFLQANAGSPVDWMPWGDAAIARAKAQQKPVFLFIGSFTSELSGAMRRQTFANPKAAEWLNAHFVCVIVDREERPDVAALFESYVSQLRQANGWPLNVWLTPDFMPFEGATYLSPSEDWGAPGFLKLAGQAQAAWASNPAACRKRATDAVAQLTPGTEPAHAWNATKVQTQLAAAAAAWMAVFDSQRGGFGDVPRLPQPELLRFLLRQSDESRDAARATLRAMSTSALRDPLDGGFFRYASDASWRIPYPQKTLADQARIALAYLDGAKGGDLRVFQDCARGALDFALVRLGHADGTFASVVDATGDDHAGYLTWSEADIDKALGAESAAFKAGHGVEAHGNIPLDDDPSGAYAGVNVLRSAITDGGPFPAASRLLSLRDLRPAPPRDERATAGAHGLLLSALTRAGTDLGDKRYTDEARRLFGTITREFLVGKDGRLRRFAGSSTPGAPEDYAALALGCSDFARATADRDARQLLPLLFSQLDSQFYDLSSNRYFACSLPLGPGLFLRPLAAEDPPSAQSLALIAGAPHANAIAAALSDSMEETNAQAPGDDLLGLALFAMNGLPLPSPAK